MNYQRQYEQKIEWKNSPDTSTPLNATNLNKMDNALNYMDEKLSEAVGGGIVEANPSGTATGSLNKIEINGTIYGISGGGGGGDSFACLGIGKKKTVTSGVIDTDIELYRTPMVGDRLLIWFDAGVDNPTGIITYNNGTAVTSNVESVSLLSYKNGWNIFEFKNDGLLYVNCWVRIQNVPIPNNTLYGLSDTQISATPTDGQVLTFDDNKWKNMALPTVQANTGTANAELKKLKIGNVVYNADSVKHYDVSAISNGAISVSVPNAGHLDGEIIAVNTGAQTGTTSSAWTLALNDGQTIEALTMSKGGSAYTDAITANCLLFVKCDIGNSTAVVLGIAGAGTTVQANPTGTPTAYLDKLKVGNGVYDTTAIKPCNVSSITSSTTGIISLPVVDTNIIGKIMAVSTGAYSGTTTNAWALSLTSGGSQVPIAMSRADGTAFNDDITANELLLVYVDTTIDHEQAIVLDIPVDTTEIKTVSGNPITLTDAVAGNAIEVSAEIVASQDLHGYDKPWVGGAGKNKLPMTVSAIKAANTTGTWDGNAWTYKGITVTILTDSDNNVIGLDVDGTAQTDDFVGFRLPDFTSASGVSYTLNGCPSGGSANTYSISWYNHGRDTGSGATSTGTDDTRRVVIEIKNGVTMNHSKFYPMMRLSTETDATFAPYSNICPISGYSTVTITNVDAESQTATVTVSLGSTVYGGTLDLTSGELMVNKVKYAITSDTTITSQTTSQTGKLRFSFSNTPLPVEPSSAGVAGDVICNIIKTGTAENTYQCVDAISIRNGQFVFYTDYMSGMSISEVKQLLIDNSAEVVYAIREPITTTLTAEQLALVKGYNQLTCNSGDMSITYKASGLDALKERVDELEDAVEDIETDMASKAEKTTIGTVENGTTASQAYAVGEHFIRNDKFCTCISAIASGATLTQGTNYVEGTIAECIARMGTYSTDEVEIGTWLGKKHYRKVIDCGALPNNSTKDVAHGLSNVRFDNIHGIAYNPNSNFYISLPYLAIADWTYGTGIYVVGNNISLSNRTDQTGFSSVYVTVEYTKNS